MGRTLPTATMLIDAERTRWEKFRRALRKEDQALLDELLDDASRHRQAQAYASWATPYEAMLVAIPFALQSPRGGRLFGVGLALAIMAGYLVVHYVALAFARADLLPPLLAAWTANIIFLGIGVSLFLRART